MSKQVFSLFGIFWLTGLLALQGIPHGGAIRTLFSLLGLIHLFWLSRRVVLKPVWPKWNTEVLIFTALTAWLLLQSGFISNTSLESFSELVSQWGKLVLLAFLGVWIIIRLDDGEYLRWLPFGIFFGFFIHVFFTGIYQLWFYYSFGHLQQSESLLGNYGYISPFVSTTLSILLAEFVLRFNGQKWLEVSNAWLIVFFVSSLMALLILNAKAAFVVTLILFGMSVLVNIITTRSLRLLAVMLILGLIFITLTTIGHNRWDGAYDSIISAIGVDVNFQVHHLWDTGDSEAIVIDPSFYVRAICMKIGLHGIIEHPFGLGFGSDAFGRYVVELGGEVGAVSSHSGWIDFTLANGIPGFLLLFLLWIALIYRGWEKYRLGNPAGLILVFFVVHFLVRSLMDGYLYGSRLTGFAFVTAILWALTMVSRPGGKQG